MKWIWIYFEGPMFPHSPWSHHRTPKDSTFLLQAETKIRICSICSPRSEFIFSLGIMAFGVSETWVQMQTLPLISFVAWCKAQVAIAKYHRLGDICFSWFWRLGSPRLSFASWWGPCLKTAAISSCPHMSHCVSSSCRVTNLILGPQPHDLITSWSSHLQIPLHQK